MSYGYLHFGHYPRRVSSRIRLYEIGLLPQNNPKLGLEYLNTILIRVPTQISFSNSLCFPCFFFLSNCRFSLCQFTWLMTITYTKLTWQTYPPSKINWKFLEIFTAKIEISFTFRIKEFTIWAKQIPCVFPVFWQNFQIPWQGILLAISPVFPVQWVCLILELLQQWASQ